MLFSRHIVLYISSVWGNLHRASDFRGVQKTGFHCERKSARGEWKNVIQFFISASSRNNNFLEDVGRDAGVFTPAFYRPQTRKKTCHFLRCGCNKNVELVCRDRGSDFCDPVSTPRESRKSPSPIGLFWFCDLAIAVFARIEARLISRVEKTGRKRNILNGEILKSHADFIGNVILSILLT